MSQGFDEIMSLYKASVRKNPALMMENLQVDSNRGVTSRGNSPHDKFASPETRAKVLEARMQEIQAFAQSRSLPLAAVYAAAEASMRTGKVPDMGQFGFGGDDAVATKQFLISNVLNIAGLEWTDYKGDPVEEADWDWQSSHNTVDKRKEMVNQAGRASDEAKRRQEQAAAEKQRREQEAKRKRDLEMQRKKQQHDVYNRRLQARGQQPVPFEASVEIDPLQFMAEGAREDWKKFSQSMRKSGGEGPGARPSTMGTEFGHGRSPGSISASVPRQRPEKVAAALLPDDNPDREESKRRQEKGEKIGGPRAAEVIAKANKDSRDYRAKLRKAHGIRKSTATSAITPGPDYLPDDHNIDPSRYMAETHGTVGGPQSAPLSPSRMSDGGDALAKPQSYERYDLLPKDVMAKLKKEIGDEVYSYTREDLFRLARSRGLLGTEEAYDFDPSRFMAEGHGRRGGESYNTAADDYNPDGSLKPWRERNTLRMARKEANYLKRDADREQHLKARESREAGKAERAKKMGIERKPKDVGPLRTKQTRIMSDEPDFWARTSKKKADTSPSMPTFRRSEPKKADPAVPSFGRKAESLQFEHDYLGHAKMHGGKFVRYIQGNIGVYDFPSEGAAQKFAEHSSARTTATPKVEGKRVFIDEPVMGEDAPWAESAQERAHRVKEESARSEVEKILGILPGDPRNETWPKLGREMASLMGLKESTLEEGIFQDVIEADREVQRRKTMTQEEIEAEEKALRERSETDKILGIFPGDPRNETWPKMSDDMARLMNLESVGVFRGPRGFHMDEPEARQIDEMTVSSGMGGFIGGGLMGGSGLTGRTVARPSYDASYELPEDPEERIEVIKKMLSKHGLQQEDMRQEIEPQSEAPEDRVEEYEAAPNSTEVPVVRDERYDSHPSRFMK